VKRVDLEMSICFVRSGYSEGGLHEGLCIMDQYPGQAEVVRLCLSFWSGLQIGLRPICKYAEVPGDDGMRWLFPD
jgi:hypothetical protein